MIVGFGYEQAKLRGQDLAREAEVDRVARAVAGEPQRRIRRGIGRGLVRLGLTVAGVCQADGLEKARLRLAR